MVLSDRPTYYLQGLGLLSSTIILGLAVLKIQDFLLGDVFSLMSVDDIAYNYSRRIIGNVGLSEILGNGH